MITAGRWDEFALLLIDVQYDFWDEDVQEDFPLFEQNTKKLLDGCRQGGIEVIHVRAVFSKDQSDWMVPYILKGSIPCIEGTKGVEVLPWAREKADEKVFIKQTFDSFLQPDLKQYLHDSKKKFLLMAGLVTSICVLFTTASAVQQGFLVALIEDCCGDEKKAHVQTIQRYKNIFMPVIQADAFTGYLPIWKEQIQRIEE